MKILKIALCALLAALLTGCCYCTKYERLYGRPLQDTRWTLVQLDGRPVEGNYVVVLSENQLTITTPGGTITAPYKLNRSSASVEPGTRTGASPKPDPVEQRILDMLPRTNAITMDWQFLMMLEKGEMWALFEAKEPKENTKKQK